MIDYKNKINSILRMLEKYGGSLWKFLSFSLADNIFLMARVVCISIETDGIYIVYGNKIFWKKSVKHFKKYPLEENKALSPEYLATVVSKALGEMTVSRASFVMSIPKTWAIIQVAEFPATVGENMSNVISYELDRLTPLSPENAYYDYKVIFENTEKINVLLAVAKAEQINRFLEILKTKNVKIEKLSISSFGIKKLIHDSFNIKNSIFISINDKEYECGAVINDNTVKSISGIIRSHDDSQISQIIKDTRPLIDLLEKSGNKPKIAISAGENYRKMFAGKLSGLTILNLHDYGKYNISKQNKDISPSALGCFLETITQDQSEMNLLSVKNGNKNKTPLILTYALVTAIILIGSFYLWSPVFVGQKYIEQIEQEINSLKPQMKKIEATKKEIETLSSDIKAIHDFKKNNFMAIDILRELTNILPEKAWLTRVHYDEKSVEIEGYASSSTAIIPKLENSKYFQKAEFASPTVRDPRQNNERFIIKMELRNENNKKKQEETDKKDEKKK